MAHTYVASHSSLLLKEENLRVNTAFLMFFVKLLSNQSHLRLD